MRGSIVWLSEHDSPDAFPPVDRALREPDGLLAAGGDLSPARLLAAYRRGIFPWYSAGQPILWWCPDPRAVLLPGDFKLARSLAKTIRNKGFETRVDTAFKEVIRACGSTEVRPGGTWLSVEMRAAYTQLHALGYAHSIETWHEGRLIGGCTAWRWAACSSGSPCSAANATPRKWRWRGCAAIWWSAVST